MKKLSAVIACYRDAPADPGDVRALDRDVPLDRRGLRNHLRQRRQPGQRARSPPELAATDPKVVVVNHTRNFGSQSAFTSGLRIATGDAAILLDGDLQDPPELIAQFHEKWLEGWDVVYGVRVRRETTLAMRVGYKLFYRLFRATAYVSVPLDAGDFSLLDRRVIDALNAFRNPTASYVACEHGSASSRRASRTYGRSVRTADRRTPSSRTSPGRDAPSSRSPTHRSTSSPGSHS